MENLENNVEDIAQWLINRAITDVELYYGEYLTHMKLQRLLYFAQGYSLAINDEPLFDERIEAWKQGVIVPKIYSIYKACKTEIMYDEPVNLDEKTAILLEFVYRNYGRYASGELKRIIDKQEPYKNNYIENERNIIIPQEEIKKEFLKDRESLKARFEEKKEKIIEFIKKHC